jgi:hypothetical protein
MRSFVIFSLLSLMLITTQSFQCERGPIQRCDNYKQDTVLLNVLVSNPATEYHLYDTIWLSSIINDTFNPQSGTPSSITRQTDQLFLSLQPFSVSAAGSLPVLSYANIEFNPVVKEGKLLNPGYGGYNFEYKRVLPNNSLRAGLVAGRTGLYIIELNPGSNVYSPFYLYNTGDYCTTYHGQNNVIPVQQNSPHWSTLGVTSVSTGPAYGSRVISQNMRNYLIFKVIP